MIHDDRTLAEIVRRIVEGWHPERIILFGSRGRGEAREHSDYDLLVIMPYKASGRHDIVSGMYAATAGLDAAQDILLTTPEEYDWRRHVAGTIEHEAARDGITLYEQPARAGTRTTGNRRVGRPSAR